MAGDTDLDVLLSKRIPPVGENGRDWWLVLSQFRAKMKQISDVPLVQADPVCQKLLQRMVEAADMKEVDQVMDLLGGRIATLLMERGAKPDDLARFGLGQARRGRASLQVVQERTFTVEGEEPSPRARTRIRL